MGEAENGFIGSDERVPNPEHFFTPSGLMHLS